MEKRFYITRCCNPFQKNRHIVESNLRNVLPWMVEAKPNLQLQWKICGACRIKLLKLHKANKENIQSEFNISEELEGEEVNVGASTSYNVRSEENVLSEMEFESVIDAESDNASDVVLADTSEVIDLLNKCLKLIGEPEFETKRLKEATYIRKKLKNFTNVLCKNVFKIKQELPTEETNTNNELSIVNNIKEEYSKATEKKAKCLLLSLLPTNWSRAKVMSEFPDATPYMIKKIRRGYTSPKKRRSMDPHVEGLIKSFYCSDENSRLMPGKKDYITVKVYLKEYFS